MKKEGRMGGKIKEMKKGKEEEQGIYRLGRLAPTQRLTC